MLPKLKPLKATYQFIKEKHVSAFLFHNATNYVFPYFTKLYLIFMFSIINKIVFLHVKSFQIKNDPHYTYSSLTFVFRISE